MPDGAPPGMAPPSERAMDELTNKLRSILRENLKFLDEGQELAMTDELAGLGLDSAGAVGLLLDIEGAFAITIPDEMLVPETFRTVGTLRDAIKSLTAT